MTTWGEYAVVYNSLSGETHYINELAIEVLTLLQVAPETLASLNDKICLLFEVDDRSALQQQLSQLIIEFDNLGLIEAAKCEN
ncbi:MAG: HPr-rel-A system PqqD family peptide chaperone [Methyloprofundus sp.]|nr:HPr-rel-A system PqqD family peptide chaperone [Methyloprofundus sp.]